MFTWNKKTEQELKSLHEKKIYSYSEIAEIMGTTRNSIAGKSHRMNLKKECNFIKVKKIKKGTTERMLDKTSLLSVIKNNGCRYMEGDPRKGGKFCGDTKAKDSQYCEKHRVICYKAQKNERA